MIAFLAAAWLASGALGFGMCCRHWRARFGNMKGAPLGTAPFAFLIGPFSVLAALIYMYACRED